MIEKTVKDLRVLKKLEKLSEGEWKFDKTFKYNIGKTYTKVKSLQIGNKYYTLKYFDGCFYPYCIERTY